MLWHEHQLEVSLNGPIDWKSSRAGRKLPLVRHLKSVGAERRGNYLGVLVLNVLVVFYLHWSKWTGVAISLVLDQSSLCDLGLSIFAFSVLSVVI